MAAMRGELLKIWPEGIETIVDLGCRDCWHTSGLPGVKVHIGVEVWAPALDRGIRKAQGGHIPGFLPILQDALHYITAQEAEAYDAVLAIDLLEHLKPAEAGALMSRMIVVAKRIAVVWTTLGMVEQGPYDVDGEPNPHEEHLWGPTEATFETLGWEYNLYSDWHQERGGAILGWRLKG